MTGWVTVTVTYQVPRQKKKSRAVMEGGGEGTLYWPGALSTLLLPADAQNHKKYHSLVKKWLEG